MMSQTNLYNQPPVFAEELEQLENYVKQSAIDGIAIHTVELGIWRRVLEIGRSALGLYLSLQGDGDVGEILALETGQTVRRLPSVHRREYQSVFGGFSLERYVYGTGRDKKSSAHRWIAVCSCPRVSFLICCKTGISHWWRRVPICR